jgi:hypothetical protein
VEVLQLSNCLQALIVSSSWKGHYTDWAAPPPFLLTSLIVSYLAAHTQTHPLRALKNVLPVTRLMNGTFERFHRESSIRPHFGLWGRSPCNRSEYQESHWGQRADGRRVGPTTSLPSVSRFSIQCGSSTY